MLFFLGERRYDVRPLVSAAFRRFGDLASVLTADRDALKALPGLSAAHLQALDLVLLAAEAATGAARSRLAIKDLDSVRKYLSKGGGPGLRILYLDGKNGLLSDEAGAAQGLDFAAVSAVLGRALLLHAVSLLLVVAREDPVPTDLDRCLLSSFRVAARTIDVTVHDLVLVAAGRLASVSLSA